MEQLLETLLALDAVTKSVSMAETEL